MAGVSSLLIGAKKSTQTFFVQSFSKPLRVTDVRAKNRGRPHQKVRFSAAPVMGRNFLTQGRPGVRVRNVRGKSGQKVYVYAVFSSLELKRKRVENESKTRKKLEKLSFSTLFRVFSAPRPRGPGNPFQTFFGVF